MSYFDYRDYSIIKKEFWENVFLVVFFILIAASIASIIFEANTKEEKVAEVTAIYTHFIEVEKNDGSKDTLCLHTAEKELEPDIKSFTKYTFIITSREKDCFKSFFEEIKEIEKSKNIKIIKTYGREREKNN